MVEVTNPTTVAAAGSPFFFCYAVLSGPGDSPGRLRIFGVLHSPRLPRPRNHARQIHR